MNIFKSISAVLIMLTTVSGFAQSKEDQKIMNAAEKAKQKLIKTNAGIESYMDTAAGYVVFPNVGKGGFIIGGASGNGVLYEDGVATGMADLKKLNIGLQAGGQSIIEVIFFEDERALNEFKQENFTFAAEASAVALKSGVAYDAKYKDGVAVFSLPKAGLMADASVGGQKFEYHPFEGAK